jgi:hypothetical protein
VNTLLRNFWIILQACVEKKYGGMAPKKPLISKVGENEFHKKLSNIIARR